MKATWAVLLVLAAALAGCSNPSRDTLGAVYGSDFDAAGAVPAVHGGHLEARVGDGPWGGTLALGAQAPLLAGPAMSAAAPQGGGGDAHALPAANATFDVRIKEATRLGGLTAYWFVLDDGTPPGDLAAAQAKLPGDGTFHASVARPGPFLVTVVLTGSSVDATRQATFDPLHGRLAVTWTATGQVQPEVPMQGPAGPKPPSPTPRQQMVDTYGADVRPGTHLVATTSFEGQYMGKEGTDVDVGLYAPDGRPIACGSSGGNTVPVVGPTPVPDPTQAAENAATDAKDGGAWSVQVGAQDDACNTTGSYYYANAGPVPYRLVVQAS
jgi:cell division septation protein DedD